MPRIEEKTIAKKILPVIYVLDTSGSMYGKPIGALNDAMRESQQILQNKAMELTQCEIKVGVLTFSNGAKWMQDHLVSLEDFFWNDVEAENVTDLGAAIQELNKKLRTKNGGMLSDDIGYYPPVLIFMSDGEPTDDWRSAYDNAYNHNGYFQVARKVCICFGDEAAQHMDVFYGLAGRESVLMADDLAKLEGYIKAVTRSIPALGESHLADENPNLAEMGKQAAKNMGVDTSSNISKSMAIQDEPPGSQSIDDIFKSDIWSI